MTNLNLPPFDFNIRSSGQSKEIFDSFRKKYVVLTPEEWVRQHFAVFLRDHLHYPQGLMALEIEFKQHGVSNRADIVVHNNMGVPWLIVECKSPDVKLTQEVFYQASRYHAGLGASYIAVTNGISHYCCEYKTEGFEFLNSFPEYPNK